MTLDERESMTLSVGKRPQPAPTAAPTATYKVWVQVELVDDANDNYEDMGLPDSLGEFQTAEEAAAFVRQLSGWETHAATSDYREELPLVKVLETDGRALREAEPPLCHYCANRVGFDLAYRDREGHPVCVGCWEGCDE